MVDRDDEDHVVVEGFEGGQDAGQWTLARLEIGAPAHAGPAYGGLVAADGEEAMNFLLRNPPFENSPRPDLVLLDLNMPKMDGFEVLDRIKSHTDLKTIPVIMLTTSAHPKDIRSAYSHSANAYFTKPMVFSEFVEQVRVLEQHWFQCAQLAADSHSD